MIIGGDGQRIHLQDPHGVDDGGVGIGADRDPEPAVPASIAGLALGHLPGDHQGRQVPRGTPGDKAPARRVGQACPGGNKAQHQVLRVDRARGLQP